MKKFNFKYVFWQLLAIGHAFISCMFIYAAMRFIIGAGQFIELTFPIVEYSSISTIPLLAEFLHDTLGYITGCFLFLGIAGVFFGFVIAYAFPTTVICCENSIKDYHNLGVEYI